MNHAESRLSNAAIAEYAERVALHHNIFANSKSADVKHLVTTLGGRVKVSESFAATEALTVFEPGNFVVHLPPMTSDRRDRFTIAHELGHYFLHYLHPGRDTVERFGRGARNRTETQANYFAAALLMPSAKFREVFKELRGDLWDISDAFEVSPRAVEVRAQALGLV